MLFSAALRFSQDAVLLGQIFYPTVFAVYIKKKLVSYTVSFVNRYPGFHDSTYPYGFSKAYWHLLTARLAFVFVFQFVVYTVTGFIAWLVPDTPDELQFIIEREREMVKTVFHTPEYDSDIEELEEEDDDDNVTQYEDALDEVIDSKKFGQQYAS